MQAARHSLTASGLTGTSCFLFFLGGGGGGGGGRSGFGVWG